MGLRADYPGTGWYKATDTGTVFCKDVPNLETHVFSDSPTEYVSVYTKEDAKTYGKRAAVSNMTDMVYLFGGAGASTFNQDISSWDVSNVTNMLSMFSGATTFNQDISFWDVSNVTNMGRMFLDASAFNQDLSNWNVGNVTDMAYMFYNVYGFNSDISNWDTSNVIKMNDMFNYATSFNQDLSQWCVTNIPTKPNDFDGGTTRWTLPKPVWGTCPSNEDGSKPPVEEPGQSIDYTHFTHVSSDDYYNHGTKPIDVTILNPVDGMWSLYKNDVLVADQNSSRDSNVAITKYDWGPTKIKLKFPQASVTDFKLYGTFEKLRLAVESEGTSDHIGAVTTLHTFSTKVAKYELSYARNDIIVPDRLPAHLTDLSSMFAGSTNFNQDLVEWDTSNVTTMKSMFSSCKMFNGDIRNWDVSNVTDMSYMLFNTLVFNRDLSNWCVSNIPEKPTGFSSNGRFEAPKPIWGTCPTPTPEREFDPTEFNLIVRENPRTISNFGAVILTLSDDCTDWKVYLNGMLVLTPLSEDNTGIVSTKVGNEIMLRPLQRVNTISVAGNMDKLSCLVEAYGSDPMPSTEVVNFSETIKSYVFSASVSTLTLPTTIPSVITSMNSMFKDVSVDISDISGWDVSNVTDMAYMFTDVTAFNQDLSSWDVSSVTDMEYMFSDVTAFNQDLSQWCVSLIPTRPRGFDRGTTRWTLPKPVWGTCPSSDGGSGGDDIVDMGLRADYPGTGWYKATDTGTVFCKDVPALETHVFSDSPIEYVSAHTAEDALLYGERAAVSNMTNMDSLFIDNDTFNEDISSWDVSNVTDMSLMFEEATAFNQDISAWDVDSVTNMNSMFYGAIAFNQDIGNWNVGNVTDMGLMFEGASSFNQDISTWNVSSVTNMNSMFYNLPLFNQDLSNWDVSNVNDMEYMFGEASSFNQDLSSWDVSSVTDMDGMFDSASSFSSDISNWNVSSVTTMKTMFYDATSFNQDISAWNVSSVTNMNSMFYGATTFNQDLSSWNVILIPTRPNDFDESATSWTLPRPVWGTDGKPAIEEVLPSSLHFTTVTDVSSPTELPIELTITPRTTSTEWQLYESGTLVASNNKQVVEGITYHTPASWKPAGSIEVRMQASGNTKSYELRGDIVRVNISDRNDVTINENEHITIHQFPTANTIVGFYTSHAGLTVPTNIPASYTSLAGMFSGASTFNQDISMWDTSNVTDMSWMLSNADTFNEPIGNWDVSNVTDFSGMFYESYSFNQDLSQWDTSSAMNMDYMFGYASAFNQDLSGWNVVNISALPDEFDDDIIGWTLPKPIWGTTGKSPEKYLPIDVTGGSGVYITLSRDGVNYTTFDMTDPSFNQLAFQRFAVVGDDDNSFAFVAYPDIIAPEDLLPEDATHGLLLCGLTAEGKVITPRHPDGYTITLGVALDPNNVDNVTEVSSPPLKINKANSVIYAKATQNIPKEYDMFYSLNGAVEGGVVKVISKATISFD